MVKKNGCTNVQKNEVVFVENLKNLERNENDKYYYVSRCKDNKVVYKISVNNKELFENSKYDHIYAMLDEAEQKLQTELPYTVNVNFIILEHLRKYFEEVGMERFENSLGSLMFAFVNDLCEQNLSTKYSDVCRDFLNPRRIEEFVTFYTSNEENILACRNRNCNPIYLFAASRDIAFTNYGIDNLLQVLKDDAKSQLQKDFVLEILTNFFIDIRRSTLSDRGKNEVCYEILRISDQIDNFTDAVLSNPIEKAKLYEKIFNQ